MSVPKREPNLSLLNRNIELHEYLEHLLLSRDYDKLRAHLRMIIAGLKAAPNHRQLATTIKKHKSQLSRLRWRQYDRLQVELLIFIARLKMLRGDTA